MKVKVLIGICITVLFLPFLSQAPGEGVKELEKTIEKKKGDLTEVQKELQDKKKKVKKKWWEEKKITDALDKIGRRLNHKGGELRKLDAEMQALAKKITHQEGEITKLEESLAALDQEFQSRVRAMYKLHRVGVVRVLFSAENYSDALRRYKAFQLVAENDLQLLQTYQRGIDEREERQKDLIEQSSAMAKKKGAVEAKKREIEGEKRKKATLLAAIKKERVAYEKAITELKAREKALHSLVQKLTTKAAALRGTGFKALRGQLPLPVKGTIFSPTGREKGIGIKAPEGTKIQAVFNGKVAYAAWFKGYGNLMIIDHGGGYHTVHAHTARLLKKVNEEVKMGDAVALVGSTGSIEGSMLYFEIRHHGTALNPLIWLALPSKEGAQKR
jgi:septal ring factor EnvC (AmiA/AmiB activator)